MISWQQLHSSLHEQLHKNTFLYAIIVHKMDESMVIDFFVICS
jgi:hypothetical protein